jgi:hypothetical protein
MVSHRYSSDCSLTAARLAKEVRSSVEAVSDSIPGLVTSGLGQRHAKEVWRSLLTHVAIRRTRMTAGDTFYAHSTPVSQHGARLEGRTDPQRRATQGVSPVRGDVSIV